MKYTLLALWLLMGCAKTGTFEIQDPNVPSSSQLSSYRAWIDHDGTICGEVYPNADHFIAFVTGTTIPPQYFKTEKEARIYVEVYCKP